jgi:hypothetical protein
MKQTLHSTFEAGRQIKPGAQLDLVVPFTTPRLTEAALRAASRLGEGLDSAVRVVRVQVVPFPLDLNHSPVPVAFLEAQLHSLCGEAPSEICFAREFEQGLRSVLRYRSLVVLASKKRPWRTRTQKIAESLKKSGYTVVMVEEEPQNA